MKIAVIGCGAIGGLFLGYLSESNASVVGVVKDYQKESILKDGLSIEGARGKKKYKVKIDTKLKDNVELTIFATKIDDLEKALLDNIDYLKDAIILTTQNGVRAEYILSNYFPWDRIVSGIVMFGATYYPPNRIVHNFEGDLILGNIFNREIRGFDKIKEILERMFKISSVNNIKGAKYLKVFINLNNCLPAILGLSMQEAFSDLDIAELAVMLNKEAYEIVKKSNIELASLPTYPKERLQSLVSMDVKEAAKLLSKIMTSLSDRTLYGSILQSIKRGRKSEIDYINGEIVRLAQESGGEAFLNKRVVELVHKVEDRRNFFTKEELLDYINS